MIDRPKHGGNLTQKEQEIVASVLDLTPDTSGVERVIGDGRYVQADYDFGKFEAVIIVSDITAEGRRSIARLNCD